MENIPFQDLENTIKQNLEELDKIKNDEEMTKQQRNTQFRKKLKEFAGEDSEFTIHQEILIELEIAYRTEVMIGKRDTLPPLTKRVEKMKEIIEERYSDAPEVREFLLESIPLVKNMRTWTKQNKWKKEVETRMRDEALFSQEKRHRLIDSIYRKAVTDGSSKHAEMWLKMSGDLGKEAKEDPVHNKFQQFQKALNKSNE